MEVVQISYDKMNCDNYNNDFYIVFILFVITPTTLIIILSCVFIKNQIYNYLEEKININSEIKNKCQKIIKKLIILSEENIKIKNDINENERKQHINNYDNDTKTLVMEDTLIKLQNKLKNLESRLNCFEENTVNKLNEKIIDIENEVANSIYKINSKISNTSSCISIFPNTIAGFYNTNVEEIIFYGNNSGGCYYLTIYEGNNYSDTNRNMLLNNLYTYCDNPYVFKFLEQFKKIKSIYFDINCSVRGINHNTKYSSDTDNLSSELFHQIVKVNPLVDIYYKCINISWNDDYKLTGLLDAFTKTKYNSFHLEIDNNNVNDNIYLTQMLFAFKNIKKHCVNNNIKFISNIGI